MILAGDVGGTNARLALFEADGHTRVRQESLPSAGFRSLEAVCRAFLDGHAQATGKRAEIDAATFGIAGPVVSGRAKVTNLPWMVDATELASALAIPRVTLINDLVALAYGTLTVKKERMRLLSGGDFPKAKGATLAVIAAGTGLGEAALVWDERAGRHTPCATEGGHTDFAPHDREEFELLEFLQARHGSHISWERIVAGPGFGALYDFFVEAKKMKDRPEIAERIASATDKNREVAALGATGASEACARALALFARAYGAEAGNLALKTFATGGVFVCGAIASTYADALVKGGFVESFVAKGRFSAFLERVPVAIVLDSDIGLAGSAYHAASSANAV